jgi:hypothetical protein
MTQLLQLHGRESAHPHGHSADTTPAVWRADDIDLQVN